MTCGKPCGCPSYRDHVAGVGLLGDRKDVAPKITTDVHDSHAVDVTEHWSERVDVTVKPSPISVGLTVRGD